jgi:hypothetical protein
MTSGCQSQLDDSDLSRVSAALVRAGQRAREIARQSGAGIAVEIAVVEIAAELRILRGEELEREPDSSQEQADAG